ncbi:MAG: glucose-1-phosphate adenylyltransferase [Deltaproteobacteria bacterium]|nr:glucose-1-phosphate adenylyltransferase [Deltaproteobacteria bacterium]
MSAKRGTITLILGGGKGTRLFPLTALRAKPAVPLGGKYRLIDVPLSNAINSGLREIYVLTQFNSKSLNAHVSRSYVFDAFSSGFVEILAANQTDTSDDWFLGTADAVRRNLEHLERPGDIDIVILSGDHLYRMDYRELLDTHRRQNADITVSCIPRSREGCEGVGVMAVDEEGMIRDFTEKPPTGADISHLKTPARLMEWWAMGDNPYLVSMGVYIFKLEALKELLADPARKDFGKHVIPQSLTDYRVAAHLFNGYWEDIGTIRSFYESNLMLCDEVSPFRFHTTEAPIYTRPRFLPASRYTDTQVERSMVSEGCIIQGAKVTHSVIGLRSRILRGASIEDSIVMGADYYEDDAGRTKELERGRLPIGIGAGASLKRAIIDKNARIGEGAIIHGGEDRADETHDTYAVRDGIVIVKKDAVIPAGSVL